MLLRTLVIAGLVLGSGPSAAHAQVLPEQPKAEQDEFPAPHPEASATPPPAPKPVPPSGMIGFTPEHAAAERAMEAKFDTLIDPQEMASWLKRLSSAPNQVGGPHDRANAEWQLAMFKSWGWDARIETFDVLYATPVAESLELLGPTPYKAKLHEPPVPGDSTSGLPGQLPPYVIYQGDGDVTAPLVYVNYGMPEDYAALDRLGVSVKGRIVIARYGGGFRGLKPKLAQEHGAVGCLIYSDPADDGFADNDVYPKGPERNADGVQRGSVVDLMQYPGDPLTPGVGATKDAKREFTRATAPTILKIPALPISYGDAQPLLAALGGPLAPKGARGALAITYHVGPSTAPVHLMVKSDWRMTPIYDVVAVMKGSEAPDQWVVRGNHHDGWVFGAEDPLSGQTALMAEVKAIGALAKAGMGPKRTLVYASWDAEEPALIGSTEWAETHADELQRDAVAYINSDNIDRGFFDAGGSPALTGLVNEVAGEVRDPESGATLLERQRDRARVAALDGGGEEDKKLAKLAAAGADTPLEAIGSGSDFSSFLEHLGVASLNLHFGGEADRGGVYHSAYDSYDHYARFGDPGEHYGAVLAKTAGRLALRLANADIVPMRFGDTAATYAGYLAELKQLIATQRDRQATIEALRSSGGFRIATDPLHPLAAPAAATPVEALDFKPLDAAIDRLKAASARYDAAQAQAGPGLDAAKRSALNPLLASLEQKLLDPAGLPGRPWYRNLSSAPGLLTGYGAKTLPGIREAIEAGRYAEAQRFIVVTAKHVDDYAAGLERAATIVD